MKTPLESEFEELVKINRASIYSVCYLYGNDANEVADLIADNWTI